jgi:hypothetical protein
VFRSSGHYFIALLAGAFAAFWPRYLSRPPGEIDAYTHVHAFTMLVWSCLLIAQPFLIRAQRRSLHRALGVLSYGVVPVLLGASLLLAHSRFRAMDEGTFHTEAPNLYLPLSALVLFGLAYGSAVLYRKAPAIHARFMICTALTFIDPVVGRIIAFYGPPLPHYLYYQALTFGATDLILLALVFKERGLAQARWVLPTMLVLFSGAHLVWFTLAQSDSWRVFAAWFRSLPLT